MDVVKVVLRMCGDGYVGFGKDGMMGLYVQWKSSE